MFARSLVNGSRNKDLARMDGQPLPIRPGLDSFTWDSHIYLFDSEMV